MNFKLPDNVLVQILILIALLWLIVLVMKIVLSPL